MANAVAAAVECPHIILRRLDTCEVTSCRRSFWHCRLKPLHCPFMLPRAPSMLPFAPLVLPLKAALLPFPVDNGNFKSLVWGVYYTYIYPQFGRMVHTTSNNSA